MAEWIKRLRSQGVKAAHPNDGWINRELKRIDFVYPDFYDGVVIGDRVALGTPSEYCIVEVVNITKCGQIRNAIHPNDRYYFYK